MTSTLKLSPSIQGVASCTTIWGSTAVRQKVNDITQNLAGLDPTFPYHSAIWPRSAKTAFLRGSRWILQLACRSTVQAWLCVPNYRLACFASTH